MRKCVLTFDKFIKFFKLITFPTMTFSFDSKWYIVVFVMVFLCIENEHSIPITDLNRQ